MTDYWAGEPVLPEKPTKCPNCGSTMIDTDLMPDTDEFDEELAIECGFEFDRNGVRPFGSPYDYIYGEMYCEDCQYVAGHGQRWYWNEDDGNYTNDKPLTPTEQLKAELERQERAGQQRLDL